MSSMMMPPGGGPSLGDLLGGAGVGAGGAGGPSLADILAAAGGQAGGQPDEQEPTDELAALQEVIEDLHELITILSDPKDTAVASQCLTALTRIQQDMMQERTSSAQRAIGGRLSGRGA
jgi:hypothetical protein